ncbi:hypothetical protein [Natrialba sp. SSL1]|uniref:hypothetical protein n=1 Tax=Natrialba sp. SSL1 TaxID=1869245 RepID=UPI0008F8A59A|nr:hypothetical protein [Natrialba sp. SSL1]OIB56040.1 hypothetical protein BBD46_21335 [Natrialba sp. SSL1]
MSDDIDTDSGSDSNADAGSESNTTRDLKAALGFDADYTPDPDTTSLPNCPRCDHPVARTSIIGPTDAIAGPCGCRVAPRFARRARNRRRNGRDDSPSATGHDTDCTNTRNNSHTQ